MIMQNMIYNKVQVGSVRYDDKYDLHWGPHRVKHMSPYKRDKVVTIDTFGDMNLHRNALE